MSDNSASRGAITALAIIFGVLTLLNLIRAEWFDALVSGLIGVGVALSISTIPPTWQTLPRWRRVLTGIISFSALGLLMLQIYLDFQR
jgi:hypothetical protein